MQSAYPCVVVAGVCKVQISWLLRAVVDLGVNAES